MREEVIIHSFSTNDGLRDYVRNLFSHPMASHWTTVKGSFDEGYCCLASRDDTEQLFSLKCDRNVDSSLHLVLIELDDEDIAEMSRIGFKVLSSFTFGGNTQMYKLTTASDLATVVNVIRGGEPSGEATGSVVQCHKVGTLLCDGLKTSNQVYPIPICYVTGLPTGWYFSESGLPVYAVANPKSDLVRVITTSVKSLPLFSAFVMPDIITYGVSDGVDNPPQVGGDSPASDQHLESSILERLASIESSLLAQNRSIEGLSGATPDLKQIELIIDQEIERQSTSIAQLFESLPTSLEAKALKDAIVASVEEASKDIRNQVSNTNDALSEIHSHDDSIKSLLLAMNDSLTQTYDDLLKKASDVALKDVSLNGSVSTLTEAIDKLGSLRALAEKSDGALDSLVTLLPALTNIQAGILSGAESLSNSCDQLMKANGKVEECTEQAVAATIAGNNTLSAMRQSSLNRDIAMTTMTALTAIASVVSSIASVRKAKGGPRC